MVNARGAGSKADARASRDRDGALRIDDNFGIDTVLLPVAGARGDVAGQRKIGLRGHGDVVCTADARFEHASAPDGNGIFHTEIVNALGLQMTANAAELDVNDFAGAQGDGGFGLFVSVYALVETDGCLELLLRGNMGIQVVPAERLLDHHEIEGIELLE